MNFKRLWQSTYINILINAIKSRLSLAEQRTKANPVLHNKAFKSILARELGVPVIKQDRAGRLYCVVNPQLNDRGQFDTNMIIYELDAQGLQFSTDTFIEQWLARKLRIIQDLFQKRNVFRLLDFMISHVGPANHDNYLLVIEPKEFSNYIYWRNKFIRRTALICTYGALAYCACKYIWLIL